MSDKLTKEHLLEVNRINENSIVFIDEIGQFASQYDFDNPIVLEKLQPFIRFFRHSVNGRLIMTDQCIDNVVVPIRRRINVAYNLNNFHRASIFGYPIPFCQIEVKELTLVEDTIHNMHNIEEEEYFLFHMPFKLFSKFKHYDSRCYSPRYKPIYQECQKWDKNTLKTEYFIDLKCTSLQKQIYKRDGILNLDDLEKVEKP
jgi:hypothetical protein